MAFKNSDDDDLQSDINIVPLVDIILVVLIIFMVTAPMIMKPSINVNLPKAASGEVTQPSLLNISIRADGKVILQGKEVSDQQITEMAEQELKKNPETQAVISADKDVAHGIVVSVLDLIKSVGVKKFAISIDKK